jgi:hypothetical protein
MQLLIHEFHCKNKYPQKGHSWHCARNRNLYTTEIHFEQNDYSFIVLSESSTECICNLLRHLQNHVHCYNKGGGGVMVVMVIVMMMMMHHPVKWDSDHSHNYKSCHTHFVNSCRRDQHWKSLLTISVSYDSNFLHVSKVKINTQPYLFSSASV